MKVLVTKFFDEKFIQEVCDKRLDIICKPFTKIKPLPFRIYLNQIKIYDALIFTSSNAVDVFFETIKFTLKKNILIFCINEKTKKNLQDRQFKNLINAKNSTELAFKIIEHKIKTVLHFCSKQKLNCLYDILSVQNIEYNYVEMYATVSIKAKVDVAFFDAIFFFSPSGVESFLSQYSFYPSQILCCIGEYTAKALKEKNIDNTILISQEPTLEQVIALLNPYL